MRSRVSADLISRRQDPLPEPDLTTDRDWQVAKYLAVPRLSVEKLATIHPHSGLARIAATMRVGNPILGDQYAH